LAEEADSGESHTKRSIRELALVLELQEVPPQFGLADLVGRLAAVIGQLANRAQVSVHRPLGLAGQMQVLGHLLVERATKVF
jgi:hypothetical protein